MITAIDSSIVLDILLNDPMYVESSMEMMQEYLMKGAVIISPVAFSECSAALDSPDDFKKVWFFDPVSQGKTGTCWCFATISFLESELYRVHGKKIKLSEMYIVYMDYVERAKAFVRERGDGMKIYNNNIYA